MFDFEIARYLYRVAFLYENIHDSVYKARAYFKSALAVDGYSTCIEKLHHEGNLRSLPSIGVSIENNICEIIEKHHLTLIDNLLGDIPDSIFDLFEYANIKNRLLKILISHKIFGFEQISNILEQSVAYLSFSETNALRLALKSYNLRRFQYAQVYEIANQLVQFLRNYHLVNIINLSDDLYFHRESLTSGNIICTIKSDYSKFLDDVKSFDLFNLVVADENKLILERFGIPFTIDILSESSITTKINELKLEAQQFRLCQHNTKQISQFYGDLHLHTDWSDGLHSIEQMRDMAIKLGYSFVAITDHSQSLKPSGMSELDTLTQIKKIRELNKKSAIPILAGIEVEILADGSLDLHDSILKEFDFVIASIHSHFTQPPFILMDRISRALSNKYVNILAHPTGRLLGRPGKPTLHREELPVSLDYLIEICRNNDVALEMNCFPERFDLSIDNAKKAVSKGVKISIGTDAHSIYHMSCAKYALELLKFTNIPSDMVLNCQPVEKLKEIFNAKKGHIEKDMTCPIEEKFKDFKFYFSNNDGILSGRLKAVGIDLTGSEDKASGFAVLSGSAVDTSLIFSDDQMVDLISRTKPDIVSIDSPLSLPEGRCCGDKKCECAKYGIMRYCELTLKRFGIGVYPCLIDSMVNLTMRGMRLALRLRKLRVNVIESYPGVAQDLLNIPRKRKGLELLLTGMKNFGIEEIRENVTHDEADAITSALVGYFYLDGKFVGLGNDKENFLIVPKLETNLSGKGLVIGLVGHIAAGKTTATEYLCFRHGFTSMRFSKLIEKKYNVSGREDLQRTGLEIASDSSKQKELSDFMINQMKTGENYVIDGIRQIVDYENLSSALGNRFILLCIEAPLATRANRYCKISPEVSLNDFLKIETHPVEKNIDIIFYKSAYKIFNNKSYKELMNSMDSFLSKLNH